MAARAQWNVPVRLVAITRAQSASFRRATRPSTETPALFTSTSRRPVCSRARSDAGLHGGGVGHVEAQRQRPPARPGDLVHRLRAASAFET